MFLAKLMMVKTMKISCNKLELSFKHDHDLPDLAALNLPSVRFDFNILLITCKALNCLAEIITLQIHVLKSSDSILLVVPKYRRVSIGEWAFTIRVNILFDYYLLV